MRELCAMVIASLAVSIATSAVAAALEAAERRRGVEVRLAAECSVAARVGADAHGARAGWIEATRGKEGDPGEEPLRRAANALESGRYEQAAGHLRAALGIYEAAQAALKPRLLANELRQAWQQGSEAGRVDPGRSAMDSGEAAWAQGDFKAAGQQFSNAALAYSRTVGRIRIELSARADLDLVLIRAGSFRMGSEVGEEDELPLHDVRIARDFWLARTEVTQAQWEAVMGRKPNGFKGGDLPVDNVSWDDCQWFVRQLNRRIGGARFRLPTEAEWEYACRAGSATEYCFGEDATQLGDYAWYGGNTNGTTQPVAQKKPNAWGLFDMHGNAREWCADWYGEYAEGRVVDPGGPEIAKHSINRGGCASDSASFLRSANRDWCAPADRRSALGFRLARSSD